MVQTLYFCPYLRILQLFLQMFSVCLGDCFGGREPIGERCHAEVEDPVYCLYIYIYVYLYAYIDDIDVYITYIYTQIISICTYTCMCI